MSVHASIARLLLQADRALTLDTIADACSEYRRSTVQSSVSRFVAAGGIRHALPNRRPPAYEVADAAFLAEFAEGRGKPSAFAGGTSYAHRVDNEGPRKHFDFGPLLACFPSKS